MFLADGQRLVQVGQRQFRVSVGEMQFGHAVQAPRHAPGQSCLAGQLQQEAEQRPGLLGAALRQTGQAQVGERGGLGPHVAHRTRGFQGLAAVLRRLGQLAQVAVVHADVGQGHAQSARVGLLTP